MTQIAGLVAAPAASAPTTARAGNIALWVLQVLSAALFVFAALPKVTLDPMAVAGFKMIGFGTVGLLVIGALEIAGAIALFIPRLTGLAALCFVALMIGAVTVTLVFMDPVMAVVPAVTGVVVAIIAYGRRHSTARLVAAVTQR